jgi:hypothetical protein
LETSPGAGTARLSQVLSHPVVRRAVVPAIAIALGNLVVLGTLIGWGGASLSFAVGPHTVYRDHLAAVVAVLLLTAVAAMVIGRRLGSGRELWLTIGVVIVTDLGAALLVTVMIPEMRRHPTLLRAVLAETAGGAQVLAVAIGATLGHVSRRQPR